MLNWRTVHVVDDDEGVCRSLGRLLETARFTSICYPSAGEFLKAAPMLSAGCILLDIRMPDMDGITLLARLNKLGSTLPVVVMTGHGDVQMAVQAMKSGAADFMVKPFDDTGILAAVETAIGKKGFSSPEHQITDAARRVATLTQREREVLNGLLTGRPNKLIAYDLSISVRTVEVHRARMMERLGVRQLAGAIRLGVIASL